MDLSLILLYFSSWQISTVKSEEFIINPFFFYLSIRERYRIEYDFLKAGEVERIEFSASKSTVVAGSIGKIRMSCI